MTSVSTWEDRETPLTHNHSEIAAEIVRRFDSGEKMTRRWVKRHLAKNMKVLEFEATWKMAAIQRPNLSMPGPKPGHEPQVNNSKNEFDSEISS